MRKKDPLIMESICQFIDEYYLEYRTSPSIGKIAEAIEMARSSIHRYLLEMDEKGLISYSSKEIKTRRTDKSNFQMAQANILGSISCGMPVLSEENIDEYVSLPATIFGSGELFILRASGESMIDAGIDDGDLVVVRKQNNAQNGDIVVALVENENTLKRFYIDEENDRCILRPENKSMDDIIVTSCAIQGIAQHVIKAL